MSICPGGLIKIYTNLSLKYSSCPMLNEKVEKHYGGVIVGVQIGEKKFMNLLAIYCNILDRTMDV